MGKPRISGDKNNDDIREMFRSIVIDNLEKMQNDLDALKPNERIKAILDLAKYVLPAGTAAERDENRDGGFETRIKELLEKRK